MTKDENIEYIDGRPVPKHKISGRPEMIELAKKGAISWEYGAFTEASNGDPGCRGRTWENEYLNRPEKIMYTRQSFDVYEQYCRAEGLELGLDQDSRVIEFGCAMSRNLIEAATRYKCNITGIDIAQEPIDKCNQMIYPQNPEKKSFFKGNLRTAKLLKQFDDNQFDLGICDHFLMCIAAGEEKKELISEITRICKGVWFHEMFGEAQADYGEANAVQSGEDLRLYDERLISVLKNASESSPTRAGTNLYVNNLPRANSKTRFYVYKKPR